MPRPGYKHETMGPSGVHCTIRFAVANLVCLIIHILHELHASRAHNTHYYKFYSSIFFDRAHFENVDRLIGRDTKRTSARISERWRDLSLRD